MPYRTVLLYVLLAFTTIVVIVAAVERWLGPNHPVSSTRLVLVGSIAVFVLELAVLFLLADTGDHFDPRCMQVQNECGEAR